LDHCTPALAKEVNRVNVELLERPVDPASAIVKGT
jgi:hypothetical protein